MHNYLLENKQSFCGSCSESEGNENITRWRQNIFVNNAILDAHFTILLVVYCMSCIIFLLQTTFVRIWNEPQKIECSGKFLLKSGISLLNIPWNKIRLFNRKINVFHWVLLWVNDDMWFLQGSDGTFGYKKYQDYFD